MSESSDALRAARSHLNAALFCLEHEREGLSISEAYYAMYHAIRGKALIEHGTAPRTHKGMGLFVHRRVEKGLASENLRDQFHDAKACRERWHYQGLDPLPTASISGMIEATQEMIAKLS